jgi:hypothetical protein
LLLIIDKWAYLLLAIRQEFFSFALPLKEVSPMAAIFKGEFTDYQGIRAKK